MHSIKERTWVDDITSVGINNAALEYEEETTFTLYWRWSTTQNESNDSAVGTVGVINPATLTVTITINQAD